MTDANMVLHGDCLEVLRTLPDSSVDSVVTDPPYGLGTREPTGEDIVLYLNGGALDTGGDFMSTDWEIPSVAVWRECFRVLKPGGYVLAFAGTRTWDIMSIGLRAAGFENRDTIAEMFGPSVLQWVHGQGFPKSLNIAKAIAKLDIPNAAELAAQWLGFGTSLKPAWEPILCFRKPTLAETIAYQVVTTGTGGMNIDGARIKHANAKDLENHKAMVAALKAKGGSLGNSWKNSSDLSGANDVKEAGRWPANVLVVHSPGCRQNGTKKVAAPIINRFKDGMKPFGNGAGHAYTSTTTGDDEGKEEVALYECVEGCPVPALDAVSDGASKYFAQFTPDAPFYYVAKASRTERNDGLVKPKAKRKTDKVKYVFYKVKEDIDTDLYVTIQDAIGDDFDLETFRFERLLFDQFVPAEYHQHFEVDDTVGGNDHPTVKPIALMQYLIRLVTPKGGITLDPYCGSGTSCKAATREEVNFIGIEKDPHYFEIAYKRAMKSFDEQEEERRRGALRALTESDEMQEA